MGEKQGECARPSQSIGGKRQPLVAAVKERKSERERKGEERDEDESDQSPAGLLAPPYYLCPCFPTLSTMPSLSLRASSRIVADSVALAIHTDHTLVVDEPSDTVVEVAGPFPDTVDVRTTSDLVLSVSGAVRTNAVPAQQMLHSAVTRHLHSYLKAVRHFLSARAPAADRLSRMRTSWASTLCRMCTPMTPLASQSVGLHVPPIHRLQFIAIPLTPS